MSTFFLQQLINGLTLGSVYGLIAIGYTMVYGIIGMINFAHGEVYMISAYLCAIGLALLSFFGLQSFPLLILGTLVFTIVVTGCTAGPSSVLLISRCGTLRAWRLLSLPSGCRLSCKTTRS